MSQLNPFIIFQKYNVRYTGYTAEKVVIDAKLISRNFTPSKNSRRAFYQLCKLAGVANSLDLIISARIHLWAENVCENEDTTELINLHGKISDIIRELYFKAPLPDGRDQYARRMFELRYIR